MEKRSKVYFTTDCYADIDAREVYLNGNKIELQSLEWQILEYLIDNAGLYRTNSQIAEACWQYEGDCAGGLDSNLYVAIKGIRSKIGDESRSIISNKRNLGYCLHLCEITTEIKEIDNTEDKIQERMYSEAFNQIRRGVRLFCKSTGSKYINQSISTELIPHVSDFESWLGDATSLELKKSIELLWNQSNWNSIYIGKSGFGKTTACFVLINEYLTSNRDLLPIYIDAEKCVRYSGVHIIAQYIKDTYIDLFDIKLTEEEIHQMLFTEQKKSATPEIILFIDGLSSCGSQDCNEFQSEFDALKINNTIQTIILANSVSSLPIVIGDMAVQRFDFQELSRKQIDTYLLNMNVAKDNVSYEILSNPLILTIYAKTNEFLKKYKGNTANYIRTDIFSSADVLWNMLEMFAVRFSENSSGISNLKVAYVFRFLLPGVAWLAEKDGKRYLTVREFVNYAEKITNQFKEEFYSDIFDEYFGYEDELTFSAIELRTLLDNTLVSITGIIEKNNGLYYFESGIVKHFFAAVYIYRYLILKNIKRERAIALEGNVLSSITSRFIGELTGEIQNKPNYDNGKWNYELHNTEILKMLSTYRHIQDENAKFAISNLIAIMKNSRENNLAGADFSNLDLRRNTFSHCILSIDTENGRVATCFNNAIVDQWCFKTPGYCKDNLQIWFCGNEIYFSTPNGSISRMKTDGVDNTEEVLFSSKDVIQDFAIINRDNIVISEMEQGISILNLKDGSQRKILIHENIETLFHRVRVIEDNVYFITRSKRLYIYNTKDNEIVGIDANAMDFVVKDDFLFIATRGREIVEYNILQRQVIKRYLYTTVSDSYISRLVYDNHKYLYAGTKEGKVIRWEYGIDEVELVADLHEIITDMLLNEDFMLVTTYEGSIYEINLIDRKTKNIINTDDKWSSIDYSDGLIATVSLEGAVGLYWVEKEIYKIIRGKESEYLIPYLNLEGCSFKGIDANISDISFIDDLRNLGALI